MEYAILINWMSPFIILGVFLFNFVILAVLAVSCLKFTADFAATSDLGMRCLCILFYGTLDMTYEWDMKITYHLL